MLTSIWFTLKGVHNVGGSGGGEGDLMIFSEQVG
jgi:hypothetical protein